MNGSTSPSRFVLLAKRPKSLAAPLWRHQLLTPFAYWPKPYKLKLSSKWEPEQVFQALRCCLA